MQSSSRIQGNIVNRQERRFLDWACRMMPSQVTSDHLTMFGVFGALLVVAGYVATWLSPAFLWLSALGYVIHWFGDSLDGSLARHRRVMRPRYGYFLDHSVDAFCILLMIGSMGLSPYVRLDVALFVVMGYFALSIYVFLKNQVTGTFQLSFMAFGPTELRIALVAITLWMFVAGASGVHAPGAAVSDYDVVLIGIGGVFISLFVINTARMIVHLRGLEGDGRVRAHPATSTALGDLGRPSVSRARGAEAEQLRPASGPRAF